MGSETIQHLWPQNMNDGRLHPREWSHAMVVGIGEQQILHKSIQIFN